MDGWYAENASLQGCNLVEQCTTPGMEEVERLRRQSRGRLQGSKR